MEPLPPIVITIAGLFLLVAFTIKLKYESNSKHKVFKTILEVVLITYLFLTFLSSSLTVIKERDNEYKERAQSVFDQNKTEGEIFSEQMKDYIKRLQNELTALRSFEYKEIELVEIRDTLVHNRDTVITIKHNIKQ